MNNNPEILIVDDVPNAAEDFGALIAAKYKFRTIATDNPDEALNIVKNHPIKVAVLDQKMPLMKGTDLFRKINEINPLIKAVMLSGEADRQEVSDAFGLGYDAFLEKTNISSLPDKVFELYTKFEIDFAQKFEVENCPIILSEGHFLFFKHHIKFHILNVEKLNENFIFNDRWITNLELHAGQNIEFEEIFQLEETITVNEDFEHKLKTEFNLSEKKLDLLKLNINNEINRKLSQSASTKKIIEKKRKVNYSLPIQPADLSANYIVKRIFEYTPVYIEFRGIVCKNCSFCSKYQPMPIIFYKQSKKIKSRQINVMKNQDKEIIDMGITQYF